MDDFEPPLLLHPPAAAAPVAAPAPAPAEAALRAKLAELGIAQFADAIVREGYQSVEDLADMDEAELVR